MQPAEQTSTSPVEPLSSPKSGSYSITSYEAALKSIQKKQGIEYVTDSAGRKFWCRLSVQFIEVGPHGEILD